MKYLRTITTAMLVLIIANSRAQYSEENNAEELCDYLRPKSFSSDKDAELAMDKILAVVHLPRNFVIQSCPNLKNAVAITPKSDGLRYIIYDPEFMRKASSASPNWSNLSILAHEIGHHLLGHTLRKSRSLEEKRKKELEADNWSGYILNQLGASLYEAQSAARALSSDGDDTYSTHPNLSKRLAAIEKGYKGDLSQNKLLKVEVVSASVESVFVEGQILYDQKKYSQAIVKFTEAIRLNPNNVWAYSYRGISKAKMEDHNGAINDYNKAIELDPLYAYQYYNRGISKADLEDYHGAINDYNKAIELDPQDAEAFFNRGVTKDDLEDYHGAINDFDKAIELDPQDAEAYYNRGGAKRNLEDYHGALNDYNKAIELDPQDAYAFFNRGVTKDDLEDYHGAINDFDKAIELEPQNAEAYYNRGGTKDNLEDYHGAINDFDKAIELDPQDAEAYDDRGNSKYALKDYKGACLDFKKACGLGDSMYGCENLNEYCR